MKKVIHQTVRRLEEYRPRYHLCPPTGGANDLQCLFWRGRYHLFYGLLQSFPYGGDKCWGHASSEDLVTWTHHPPCLEVTDEEKAAGVTATWTGHLIVENDAPIAFYTQVWPQVQCVAISEDAIHWRKSIKNPVITEPPAEFKDMEGFGNFRDPCVWKEDDGWHMALGSGIPQKGSAVLHYHSKDMYNWTYLKPLFVGPTYDTDMYECPDFFELDGKYALIVSTRINGKGKTLYFTGRYENNEFIAENEGYCDFNSFYAAKTLLDDRGRRVLFGWLPENWSRDMQFVAGWAGAYSMPRLIRVDQTGRFTFAPVPEMENIRGKRETHENLVIEAGKPFISRDISGCQLEIVLKLETDQVSLLNIELCRSPDNSIIEEKTIVTFDSANDSVSVDRRLSSKFSDENVTKDVQTFKVVTGDDGKVDLHIFLDHSVLEIFANDRSCWSGRIYPHMPESDQVALTTNVGKVIVDRLDIWRVEKK